MDVLVKVSKFLQKKMSRPEGDSNSIYMSAINHTRKNYEPRTKKLKCWKGQFLIKMTNLISSKSTGSVTTPSPLRNTTSHKLFSVAPDWSQQLGKASSEAFAEGLRVALKPLEEGTQCQTKALENLAKEVKKTARVLRSILKALPGNYHDHRQEDRGGPPATGDQERELTTGDHRRPGRSRPGKRNSERRPGKTVG